jgi:hypothetical protein
MAAKTPTGTIDGEVLNVAQIRAIVWRLEQTVAELQVENSRIQ